MSDGLELLEEHQPTPSRQPVQQSKEPEQTATVDACHPDVWDETGRLISNVLIIPEPQTRRRTFTNDETSG